MRIIEIVEESSAGVNRETFPGVRLHAGFFVGGIWSDFGTISREVIMAKADKEAKIGELTDKFRDSSAVLLTEYRGLSVGEMKDLRRALGSDVSYAVVKNTLATLAAKKVGFDFLEEDLNGPTAIAFVGGEPVEAAKALRDFAKANPALVIKSGAMDGQLLTQEGVKQLADLESREVLLAKAAGAMKGKISQAAYAFAALPTKVAQLSQALADKRQDEAA